MAISLKIFISKDEPIILNNCHDSKAAKVFVKSVSIFLNYNNLDQNIHHYTYDGTKIGFKDGYYIPLIF